MRMTLEGLIEFGWIVEGCFWVNEKFGGFGMITLELLAAVNFEFVSN